MAWIWRQDKHTAPTPPVSALLEHTTALLRQQEEEIACLKSRLVMAQQQHEQDEEEISGLRAYIDRIVDIVVSCSPFF